MWVRVPPSAKKNKKGLDKPQGLCYNKDTKARGNQRVRTGDSRKATGLGAEMPTHS